jgi:hypothetical protein
MLGLGGPHLQNQCCSPENRQYIFSICTPLLQLEAKKTCSLSLEQYVHCFHQELQSTGRTFREKKAPKLAPPLLSLPGL